MELSQYWQIIWRRAWIPLLLVAVVGAASWLTWSPAPTTYSTSMRFTVRVLPDETRSDAYNYDRYYEWLSSEYMADDLTAIVSSQRFAENVNAHLAAMDSAVRVPPGAIGGLTFGEKQHRIVQVNLSWGDAAELEEIAQAVVQAMEQDAAVYLSPPQSAGTAIEAIDLPGPPGANPPSLTERLNIPVRLLLAFGAGIVIAFLLEYLDSSVRQRTELEAIGIPVLGEVPKGK